MILNLITSEMEAANSLRGAAPRALQMENAPATTDVIIIAALVIIFVIFCTVMFKMINQNVADTGTGDKLVMDH